MTLGYLKHLYTYTHSHTTHTNTHTLYIIAETSSGQYQGSPRCVHPQSDDGGVDWGEGELLKLVFFVLSRG